MNRDSTISPNDQPDLPASAQRPPQIRASHHGKLALVYTRQSTAVQVREHSGSTADQRALADLPHQWGWPDTRIRVIDEDLGLSGTSAENRTGFQKMLELMDRGEVGVVVVRDVSRISRDPHDSETFLTKLIRHRVLLYASGQLFDGATEDLALLFGRRIQALLGWFDNQSRARMMRSAKIAKARQGHAVTRPPVGYVKSVQGKWVMDPDVKVQEAVRSVFDLYRETGSIGNVLRYMWRHKRLFPRRLNAGEIIWSPPTRSHLGNVLTNRLYTGDYVFGRFDVAPSAKVRSPRIIARPQSEWIVVLAHHEAYLSHEEWQAIQTSLASQRPTVRPPIGRGHALLQGLMWCVACERWLRTLYDVKGGVLQGASYSCQQKDRQEVRQVHLSCPTKLVDASIVDKVLSVLKPLEMRAALAAIKDHGAQQAALAMTQRRHLQQAEDDVEEARRRYRLVDPSHQLVKADLEQRYEDALTRLEALRREMAEAHVAAPAVLRAEDAHDLVTLSERIEALWAAPTTTNEDRKRLLRIVITRVLVHEVTKEAVELEIVWASGLQERCRVLRSAGVDTLVQALRATGKNAAEITDELRASGVKTPFGRPMLESTVQGRLARLGIGPKAMRRRVMWERAR